MYGSAAPDAWLPLTVLERQLSVVYAVKQAAEHLRTECFNHYLTLGCSFALYYGVGPH